MSTAPKTVRTYPLNSSDKDFTIPFEYLARKFVVVTLIGSTRKELVLNTDYRFSTATTITTNKAWGPGDTFNLIEIRRLTSATERLVDFTDGSILRAYDLNISSVQSLHIAEEARDLTADTIGVNNDGDLDARARKIVNVADGVNDGDAVNIRQQKAWSQSALNSSLASERSAQDSYGHAVEAGRRMDVAGQYADIAAQQAMSASDSKTAAKNSADSAKSSSDSAQTSATSASDSKTAAKNSADAAAASAASAGSAAQAVANKQDRSNVLDDLSQLQTAQDKLIMATGSRGFTMKPITALAQSLIASQSQADMREALGLSKAGASRLFGTEVITPATFDDGYFWGFKGSASGQGNGNKTNLHSIVIESDQIVQRDGVNGMTGLKVEGFGVRHLFGGGPTEGGRHAGGFLLQQVAATAPTNKDKNYVGVQGHVITTSGDGGVDGSPAGAYFAGSGFTAMLNDAYQVMNATSWEFNTYIQKGVGDKAGKRVNIHTGIQIASYIEERGYGLDTAISIGCLSPSPLGWKYGLTFSNTHGSAAFGNDSIAVKLLPSCAPNATIDGVIDLVGVTTNFLMRTSTTALTDKSLSLSKSGAGITLGDPNAAGVSTYRVRTSGLGAAYDFQLTFSGGTSALGKGVCQLEGDAIITPFMRPDVDGTRDVGASNFRYKTPWFTTSMISTSDARKKTPVRKLNTAEIEAAKAMSREVGIYQWLDSIERKGEEARLFLGMTVQRAIEILRESGLDPFRYSFICFDKWESTPAVIGTDDEGNEVVIREAVDAGELYSFRKDDLHAFMIAGIAARLEAAGI